MGRARRRGGSRQWSATGRAPDVGLVVAAATAPGTFAPSLSPRSALDQGLVTGLATGLHYLLAAGAQDALEGVSRFLVGGAAAPAARRTGTIAVDCAAVPLALAVLRALPSRTDAPLRGAVRQAAWRLGTTGLSGALLSAAELGMHRLDDRLDLGGRLAAVPVAVPVGLGLAYVVDRVRAREQGEDPDGAGSPSPSRVSSLAVATGIVGGLTGAAYGEHLLADRTARRLAAVLPGPVELWRLAGHAGFLLFLGSGAAAIWRRAMRRIEAGTSADVPVLEPGEAERWVPSTVSGGPGSVVAWAALGREGRRHALASVRPRPLATRPDGVPDLSIETVMGERPRSAPVQVYVGLDSAATPRERVDLAIAEIERTGALDRSLLVLVSPTGTGYVNYVAVAALQYLTLGDVATVTLQYSRRPSPLSLGMVQAAREQNRLLWLRVLERVRDRPGSRPRVVLFGESLGAHTSQDVFLHWGTLGLDALGIDRALWIGTPYASKWMQQVTGNDRLDVDQGAVAVVNDHVQLEDIISRRGREPRFVLLSHDNDGVTRFGPHLLWARPGWLGPDRPRVQHVDGTSPRGVPSRLRWRPVTTFCQSLVDMKNAQVPGTYRAWAHDYRADLPQVLGTVYDLPATAAQLARIEEVLQTREAVREHLFTDAPAPVG